MSAPTPSTPRPGDVLHDRRTGRTGILMDVIGGRYYLRPLHGGIEWTTRPEYTGPPPSPSSGPPSPYRRAQASPNWPSTPSATTTPARRTSSSS
ncbi:hypothetical protein ACIG5E_23305 [Kitasatospora sp. NPDC053057]|uniref:hypothetical protein n=1 Tax=Kitasatospora sp. NPDC053057 TaxID=3364062 RepID=UPI0037CBC9CF